MDRRPPPAAPPWPCLRAEASSDMHWRQLLQAATLFREQEPRAYLRYYDQYIKSRSAQKWESPDTLDIQEAQLLIDFINQWATRTPMKPGDLLRGYRMAFLVLQRLKGLRFETVNLSGLVGADGETVASAIAKAFGAIATCGRRNESTGASKILHTLQPDLFVMWDMRIAGGYGLCKDATQQRPNGHEYAHVFLPRLKYEADEAIATYLAESPVATEDPAAQITSLAGAPTFPKLLDEYNYMKYTLGASLLWRRTVGQEVEAKSRGNARR